MLGGSLDGDGPSLEVAKVPSDGCYGPVESKGSVGTSGPNARTCQELLFRISSDKRQIQENPFGWSTYLIGYFQGSRIIL